MTINFNGSPLPEWATAKGEDYHGVFVDFSVGEARQRLRWCPPGRFLMGSPEDEPGRYDDEGPRHEVHISHGFWMFDTPCTQALWEAVMGENPSHFRSPTRPVEQVSWYDTQEFLQRINILIPGLHLVLPSEAQWEYACRAGTDTALYSGPIYILGANNAPALDHIAWYAGNSGKGFELVNGYYSSGWSEKQYASSPSGTHPVGLKQPNAWGLYDMLGNVWEWVADRWPGSYQGAPAYGSAWLDAGAELGAGRVVRGGSWSSDARSCRCACRFGGDPGNRFDVRGFRCALVQKP